MTDEPQTEETQDPKELLAATLSRKDWQTVLYLLTLGSRDHFYNHLRAHLYESDCLLEGRRLLEAITKQVAPEILEAKAEAKSKAANSSD